MDLLDPQSGNLHVREDIKKGVYVESLQEEAVSSVKDMINLITRGARNRHVGSTSMNKESSRSHSVLTTQIESKIMSTTGVWQMKSSRFHIIDLAGSERSKHTNSEGQRLKEAGMINKSLSALGIVINSLVDISEGKTRHVHYRDSKLTFLLRDSLGGNSKTTIIANITPGAVSCGETLSTLKFAQRAKLIKNKAVINEESSSTIHLLKAEIRRLKMELAESAQERILLQNNLNQKPNQDNLQEFKDLVCVLCKSKLGGEDDLGLNLVNQDSDALDQSSDFRKFDSSPGGHEDSNISLNVSQFATQQFPGTGQNPKAFKMYKERLEQLKKAQKRIVYLENLLSANLDNLTNQQKYYELKIDKSKEQTERMQSALETFEKQSSRDKMIIKFREQRIQKLEQKYEQEKKCKPDGTVGCTECQQLADEILNLKQERDFWKESTERNPQAAKLFVEKAELIMQKQMFESEAKATPESLTAQIRGLNDLTESLSNYLKEHCESRSNQREEELMIAKNNLGEQVAQLEQHLQMTSLEHKETVEKVTKDLNIQIDEYITKIEQLKHQFHVEKSQIEQNAHDQIEQIKHDLETVSGETNYKELSLNQLRIESIEKQNQLQQKINALQDKLNDLEEKELKAQNQIIKLIEIGNKHTCQIELRDKEYKELQIQSQWQFEENHNALELKIQKLQEKNFIEVQNLEKEVMQAQQSKDLIQESLSETLNQLDKVKKENDLIGRQLLESQEANQESLREVIEKESQLGQLVQKCTDKEELIANLNFDIMSLQSEQKKIVHKLEKEIQRTLEEMHTQKEQLTKEIQEGQSREELFIVKVKQENQVFNNTKQALETQIAEKDSQLLAQKENCGNLQSQLNQAQEQIQQQRESLGRSMQTLSQIDSQAKAFSHETSQLKQDKLKIQTDLQTTKSELQTTKTQLLQTNNEFSISKNELSSKNSELQLTKSELQQTKQQLEDTLLELQGTKEQMSAMDDITVNLTNELEQKSILLINLNQDFQKKQQLFEQDQNHREVEKFQLERTLEKQIKESSHNLESQIKQLKLFNNEQICQLKEQAKAQLQEETSAVQDAVQNHFKQLMQQQEVKIRNELKVQMSQSQESILKVKHSEMQELKQKYHLKKEKYVSNLLVLMKQVSQLKSELKMLRAEVYEGEFQKIAPQKSQLIWIRQVVALAQQMQQQAELQLIQKHSSQVQLLEGKVKERQKQSEQQKQCALQSQQDCLELKEQLNEYKGLTHQLTEEKHQLNEQMQHNLHEIRQSNNQSSNIIESLNTQLMTTQRELAESHQMLSQQKQLLDDSLKQLNNQHIEKYHQQKQAYADSVKSLGDEIEKYKQKVQHLTSERDKLFTKTREHKGMLISNKDTITNMVNNENQLMTELKKKITELGETQENWKSKVIETKQEKECISFKADTLRKENENLRELIKLKDGQIQDNVQFEANFKQDREKLQKENKDLKHFFTTQETQMKEVVRTLKAFSEEKKRLEAEIEQLKQNEFHIGHDNKMQKVQYHLKIKEEFNILKEENDRLQEELRKRTLDTFERQSNSQGGQIHSESNSSEMARMKKDQYVILEAINQVVEYLLQQPGVSAYVSENRELKEVFRNQLATTGTASAPQTVQQKLRGIIEVIQTLGRNLASRIKECNDTAKEFKRMESGVIQLQKEKTILTQQIDAIIHKQYQQQSQVPQSKSSMSTLNQIHKERFGSGNRESVPMIPTKDSQPFQVQKMQLNMMHQQVDQQSRTSSLNMQKSNSRISVQPKSTKPSQ